VLLKKRQTLSNDWQCEKSSIEKTREFKLNILTYSNCQALFKSTTDAITRIVASKNIPYSSLVILTWNGATVMGESARAVQKHFNCSTLFFEISNIPGKIFVDPQGVNSQSKLFKEPSVLEGFSSHPGEYEAWKKEYIKRKIESATIPQASLNKKLNAYHFFDFLYTATFGHKTFSSTSLTNKLNHIVKIFRKTNNKHKFSTNLPDHFVFFPMQVSNDTQIMINSNTNNINALQFLIDSSDHPLVIKPHPAEPDISYIFEKINKVSSTRKIYITNTNTLSLINSACSVVTINSTTGLESIIMGKPTTFLGQSLYANLNSSNLGNYILGYLIDVDFFSSSSTSIDLPTITKIYSRTSL
jgi:capsular polysaccharide export protein